MAGKIYYVTPGKGNDDYFWDAYGPDMLARTVIEEEELFDVGLVDQHGNKIMAKKRKDSIGYYPLRER